jgi:hypothetical protein
VFMRPIAGAVLASVMAMGGRSGAPPNSCKFVSVAEVTELIGKPVGGGQISVVDNPKSLTSTCAYTVGGIPTVIVMVADYPSAAAAKQELATEQANSNDNKTETGVGDAAFWTSVGALQITAVEGSDWPRLPWSGARPRCTIASTRCWLKHSRASVSGL